MKYGFVATGLTAAGLIGLGILAATPATADPAPGDCRHDPSCYVVPPFNYGVVPDTVINYSRAPGITLNNYKNLPHDTIQGYEDFVHDTIRNYTGIGAPPDPSDKNNTPEQNNPGDPNPNT